ncbi:acyl carrier protein [Streptomyces olivaceoviridis]|uniref:acyl carrier protein n=1 Tax=Streptomyces olivaceoviridis TaxID=1921 RepID=UPI0037A25C67
MENLRLMPVHERREIIGSMVVEELKTVLFMTSRDEFPLDIGLFDLGLTSLRLSEVKLALEQKLECAILRPLYWGIRLRAG